MNSPISTAALREGMNSLAVEVHQPNGTSTDLGFDMELLVFSDKSPAGITQRVYRLKKGESIEDWDERSKSLKLWLLRQQLKSRRFGGHLSRLKSNQNRNRNFPTWSSGVASSCSEGRGGSVRGECRRGRCDDRWAAGCDDR